MARVFSPEDVSLWMSKVRSTNTRPELIVRSLLHRMGYRFRLHRKSLPGKPDIVLPKYQSVILVHGCFWHGHEGCRRSRRPKSNLDFWDRKLSDNKRRDHAVKEALKSNGWSVLVVWECETKNLEILSQSIADFLTCKL